MHKKLLEILKDRHILILGFGREGQSTYRLLINTIPENNIAIADQNKDVLNKIDFDVDANCRTILGEHYLENLDDFDLIIKSPGISRESLLGKVIADKITSQTDLFLRLYSKQTIGITGTKGKSTTSSLIKYILSNHLEDVILVGNIGVPPFDMYNKISKETKIVFELSSYQLEDIFTSPAISVLLNFYEEHLDHHKTYLNYQLAKFNITKFQQDTDWLIINGDDDILMDLYSHSGLTRNLFKFSFQKQHGLGVYYNNVGKITFISGNEKVEFDFSNRKHLPGDHNLMNILASVCVCKLLNIPDGIISKSINEFKGLEHRMEYVGKFGGILFYNDSIATIPEATMHAVRTLKKVDTLILGGKDRGIDYSGLVEFLLKSRVRNLIILGNAGKRILDGIKSREKNDWQNYFFIDNFEDIEEIIKKFTKPDHICLLSPAASSYDMFENFEERGKAYKRIAGKI